MPSLNSNSKNKDFTLPNLNDTIKMYTKKRQKLEENQNNECDQCKADKCPKLCTPRKTRINIINNNLAMLIPFRKQIKNADKQIIVKIKKILKSIEKSTGDWEAAVIENSVKKKFKF